MKKYLMTGVAALAICAAFTSCSKSGEELYDADAAKGISTEQEIASVYNNYNQAFIKTFGQVNPNVDWGFGTVAGTRANPGTTYPATHTYANGGVNANANEWANPNKEFGGWVVPIPLTDDQKTIVKAYFQSKPNISYEDPHFRHFFVQQVYKGNPETAGANSTEKVIAADGSEYTSNQMNHLTVGQSNMHINNFNAGTCSSNDNVLQNDGTTKTDQIMLMVNIDDTSCFGYHDSGSSNQPETVNHNDKAALVSWQTIRTWANANGYNGELLNDGWNRSFMGFDLAIKEGADAYATDNNGNVIYATYDKAPGQPIYAWDGQNIFPIADQNAGTNWQVIYKDAYQNLGVGYLTTNENFYVAAEKVSLNQTYSFGGNEISSKSYDDFKNYVVLDEVKVEGAQNGKAKVLNLKRINDLIADGFLPVKDKSLQDWVKVGVSDGVFSDWIVTLTEAQRQDPPSSNKVRIMAEDLNAQALEGDIENSDWDFNDVVFDVEFDAEGNGGTITLICAGGVLPLTVAGEEVHLKFDSSLTLDEKGWYPMINTGKGMGIDRPQVSFHIGNADKAHNGQGIEIKVQKTLSNGEKVWLELSARKGQPCSKFAVKPTVQPCLERDHIDFVSDHAFSRYVANGGELIW